MVFNIYMGRYSESVGVEGGKTETNGYPVGCRMTVYWKVGGEGC